MAAKALKPTPVQHIQHERFTTKQHGYLLLYLSLDLSGNIAVSGYHSSRRTYIDLYSGDNSDSRDKLKLFYSKEFEKYSGYFLRYVSFLDKNVSKLVTCIGDKIEIIDMKNESKVLRSCRVNGVTTCLAVREGEIFIGLRGSQTVLVFNNDLKETKKIRIKGIKGGDYPCDLQVIKDTVFVCTAVGRALSLSVYDGSIASEYTDTTAMYVRALSISASEEMNLVAVLWYTSPKRGIIVYSLNKNKSFLVFDVDNDVTRIRISDRDRMIITGNRETGEIEMYSLEQLFSFEAMKRTLAYIVSPEECEELRKYFGVTEEEMRRLEAGDEDKKLSDKEKTVRKMECLLTLIEEKGHLNSYNIDELTGAVSRLGDEIRISDLKGPMEGYCLHNSNMQITVTEMMTRQKAWEDERNQLSSKVKKHEKILDDLQDQLVQVQEQEKMLREDQKIGELKIKELKGEKITLKEELQQSSKQMETLTEELEQMQMKSAKDIKTLIDELKQTKQSKTESERQIETLTEELKQSKTESDRQIEALEEELKETKESKTESDRQIQTMTEELRQIRIESTKKIETLTEELEQTEMKSATEMETLTEELAQVKRESYTKIEILTEELEQTVQVLDLTKTYYANKIERLTTDLNETKQKLLTRVKELETTNKELELTKQTLKETAKDRENTETELKQYQLDFAKQSKALKEVLNQTKEAMAELHKRPVEDKSSVESEETRDEDGAILAAEFGRLTVAIAEHLRLDDCLRLARVCNIPVSDCDTLLRVSSIESPGMKLLDVLKKRKVINMFDVTNLQKALAVLQLEAVNHDLVAPYQEKIDKEQYELNKVEEMNTWEEIDAFVNAAKNLSAQRQIRDSQTSQIDDTRPEYASQTEAAIQHTEAGDEGRGLFLGGRHHHQLYTECSIGREGGTIQLANVSLTVPPNALHESHVIAISVMNESPFPLDREVDTARMTPLIKLEPLGLKFKKSLQLNIPHSALISEPEDHDVIIYSGQITKNDEDSSDSIRWTEERSITRQLKEKSVTVDIQCLTYLSASLVSQTSAPPLYIVRAIPFVDGVRNTDDDIVLTICFCSDNDSEYNMLLSDYNTKLTLEQYSTIQLCRHPERDEDDAGFLSVTVTSVNNTYVPDADQAVKQFSISHLCTASRVSHQLRLQKNRGIDGDDVHVLLTFSQAERTSAKIFMKARIKDLMISQESEDFLIGSVSTVLEPYDKLKANISSMLENDHYIQLATFFNLTPAEAERVKIDASPGRILMKILDEREMIMPQKMFGLYQGLNVCHLDQIARLVFEYIEKNLNETQQEKHKNEKEKCAKGNPENASVSQRPLQRRQNPRSRIDKSVQTTVTATSSSSDSVLKMLNQEQCLDEDRTSDTLSITHRLYTTLKWMKEHLDIIRYILPVFLDGILQTHRGDVMMLLSDYQTKLPLEQYSNLHLHRHSERDEDDAGFLSVTVTSQNNTYVPDTEQAVKIKDLIISEESSKLRLGSVTPGNKMYEDMVVHISSSLDTEKCRELGNYFQLNSEDIEMVVSNQDPGKMLMKTLEERSLVDSQKMIYFFEGLKACHLDKTAKLVADYISEFSKLTQVEGQKQKEDKNIEDVQNTSSNMHTDQTITNVGGTMCIPGTDVRLKILPNSLPKGVEQARIRMEIITSRLLWNQPVHSFASNSSVVVELLPNHLQLQRCALLTLPHCLKLKTTSHNAVKVFVSHHSKDSKPCWEEKPLLDYQLDDNALTLHLDTFCWVKYEIDDEVVEAKKIQVFAARPDISQEDETTKVELGYHPDLPGAGEILRNNEDLVKVEKKPFLFVREGNADLEIVGSHIEPAYWEFCKTGENVKKISFRMIAASVEKSRPFFLRRINIGTSYCEFQVSQASQASEIVELSLSLKPVGGVPAPTSRAEYNAMEDKMLDCFMFLKSNLVNDWKDVGRYLEVPEAELSRFSRDINIGESIFQMLLYWQRKNASKASTERLVKALKKLNRKDLIEKITEILN